MKERPSRTRQSARPRPAVPSRKAPASPSEPKSTPPKRRWKRLAAFVARQVEQHTRLAQDSMRIALTLAILVLAIMLAHTFYRVWQETTSPPPNASAPR